MEYDEHLTQRIRDTAESVMDERKMFGGLAFLLDRNMAVGVNGDELMVRIAKEEADELVTRAAVRRFKMGKKNMAGWVPIAEPRSSKTQVLPAGSTSVWPTQEHCQLRRGPR